MVKYLGSKRLLIPAILEQVRAASPEPCTVLDLFSGTSRVGHALKREGYRVLANTGLRGGQEVPHLHMHIFGGTYLGPMLAR